MSLVDPGLLFLRLRKHFPDRENCPENFLTDCVAAALVEDQQLARAWVALLVGAGSADGVPLDRAAIEVHTQVHEDSASIPDLVLEVVNEDRRIRIGVEHKIDAAEGVNQLGRYVRLPGLWAVAAVTRRGVRTQLAELTSGCATWLHPAGRTHFTWTDFYPMVEDHARRPSAPVLTRALRSLFDDLRFAPEHVEVGRLGRGGSDAEREQRSAFFANWSLTERQLQRTGWSTHPGKNSQLYFKDRPERTGVRIQRGILSPLADDGRTLRVKLRYRTVVERDGARKELSAALPARIPCGSYVTLESETATRAEGECYFLDVNVPMARVLPSGVGERERSEALAAYVSAVLGVAD